MSMPRAPIAGAPMAAPRVRVGVVGGRWPPGAPVILLLGLLVGLLCGRVALLAPLDVLALGGR
eukprot:13571550-Alexandrium_andersonii.AAC.1